MEELDITQLLNYFKSKIIYIIFTVSIAFCLSSIYVNKIRVPEYTSTTTILLNRSSEEASLSSTDVTLNKSLVTTYGEIIKSKRVLRQVISDLNLDMNYSTLYRMVSVGSVTDTSIISVKVTDQDNEEAAAIANSIASVFTKEIVEIYNIDNVSIIDAAEVATQTSSSSSIKIITVGTLAGAFLAIVIIFIVYYFDTTVKDESDIEKITGLPVIGIVPISKEKIKHVEKKLEPSSHKKDAEVLPIVAMRATEEPKEEVKKEEPKTTTGSKVASAKKPTTKASSKKKYYYGNKK